MNMKTICSNDDHIYWEESWNEPIQESETMKR